MPSTRKTADRLPKKIIRKERRASSRTGVAKKGTKIGEVLGSVREIGKAHITRASSTKPKSVLIPSPKERSTYRTAFDLGKAEGNTDRLASLLLKSHKEGDGRATYALATWYIHGEFFDVNAKKAFRLLREASKKGIRDAIFDLAHAYEIGFGVAKSESKAFGLYLEAARKGDTDAVEEVVRCIFYGIGVSKNRSLAFFIEDLYKKRELW
jgi:hypothetical protein